MYGVSQECCFVIGRIDDSVFELKEVYIFSFWLEYVIVLMNVLEIAMVRIHVIKVGNEKRRVGTMVMKIKGEGRDFIRRFAAFAVAVLMICLNMSSLLKKWFEREEFKEHNVHDDFIEG